MSIQHDHYDKFDPDCPACTSVQLDRTGVMFVRHLRELYSQEPPTPNHDDHNSFTAQELARAHDHWAAQVAASRLLLGVRLVNAALDED